MFSLQFKLSKGVKLFNFHILKDTQVKVSKEQIIMLQLHYRSKPDTHLWQQFGYRRESELVAEMVINRKIYTETICKYKIML